MGHIIGNIIVCNTFTQAFVITRLLEKESNAPALLFLLDASETDVITKLQQYAIKHFNQGNDTHIMNDVFNRIILTFPQQYRSIISYDNRSKTMERQVW